MEDVTEKYSNMIQSFECDFSLLDIKQRSKVITKKFQVDQRLIKDIEHLKELSFGLRYGKIKIVQGNNL